MSKELKIKGALGKDYQQIYIDDDPIGVYINEEGKVKLKDIVVNGEITAAQGALRLKYNDDYTVGFDKREGALVSTDGILMLDVDHIKVNSSGTSGTGGIHILDNFSTYQWLIDSENRLLKINDTTTASDTFQIEVDTNGATKISTTDFVGTSGHIEIEADGDITLDPAGGDTILSGSTLKLDATKKLYFDGGGDTYIDEASADVLGIVVGGDTLIQLTEAGVRGNYAHFGTSAGFTQAEPTYNATDTDVKFLETNKNFLTFGAGNITDVQLYFPPISGNFTLLIKQDGTGSREIANWKAFDKDGSAASGSATVKFAGGSNPTLTTDANHVDIISFYWDNDNGIAYGVATLDFQF